MPISALDPALAAESRVPHVIPKRVLIVDDSATSRRIVRRELEPDGYEIAEAGDGREALDCVERGFTPDLVVLDVEMPELDGFSTCERLYSDDFRHRFRHLPDERVPVVFFTGSDTLDDRRRGFELGALDFVHKKFEAGALARRVRQILSPGDRLRNVQVLLVDESRVVRTIVGKALRSEGVQVHEAEDGLRAFELLCNRTTEINLVITNIEMRGLDGLSLCRRIRRELGLTELPVVFLTSAGQAQRLDAFHAGATDCLAKPFIHEELIARVVQHIERAQIAQRLIHALNHQRANLQWQNDMLATLSHDMRSPLSGIMGFAEHLLLTGDRAPAEQENLTLIKQSGQMLLSLVEDILSLAKHDAGRAHLTLTPLDVAEVARRSVAALRHLAQHKRQSITFTKPATSTTVAGDGSSLMRVFNNLLSNAIKFTPIGGTVQVDVAVRDKQVIVSVIDSGVGIAADSLPHLFDRFSRLSRPGTAGEASTGLGMTIVKEFVEAHHGAIEVESTPGSGSTFRVSLPRISVEPAAVAAEPSNADRHAEVRRRVRGLHVLVADDNPVNQAVAKAVLANAGCTVTTASDGQTAFNSVISASPAFDAIFMDVEMPGMDGLDATRALRSAGFPSVPVIALTGHAAGSDRHRCLEAGMNEFIEKPINPTVLLEMLSNLCPTADAPPAAIAMDR